MCMRTHIRASANLTSFESLAKYNRVKSLTSALHDVLSLCAAACVYEPSVLQSV